MSISPSKSQSQRNLIDDLSVSKLSQPVSPPQIKRTETILVPPKDINPNIKVNIYAQLKHKVEGQVTPEYGLTIAVTKIEDFQSSGIIDVHDGSVHFKVDYESLIMFPKKNEIIPGTVSGMTDQALIQVSIGPISCVIPQNRIGDGNYQWDEDSRCFVHTEGLHPPITSGTRVRCQVTSSFINQDFMIIGSIIKVFGSDDQQEDYSGDAYQY